VSAAALTLLTQLTQKAAVPFWVICLPLATLVSNKTYRTRNEAKADVFDYIEASTTLNADTRRSDI
jgi:hypothetical protein